MKLRQDTEAYYKKLFPKVELPFVKTDPEYAERFCEFAFNEVVNQDDLDDKSRFLAILAMALGCQGIELFRLFVPAAINSGLTPTEIREVVYQATDYLGLGRVLPFINAFNEIMRKLGIDIPLANQSTTTLETRLAAGEQAQIDIFGECMRGYSESGPAETKHINKWLTANCFGDYYTCKGLSLKERELITFCFLAAQGGCEPQLLVHAKANFSLGNDKQFLIKIVSQCVPYIGYPRTLNALSALNKADQN